jgi:hypothetical protein
MGVFAMVADAENEATQRFYEHHGFTLLPGARRRLFLPIDTALRRLASRWIISLQWRIRAALASAEDSPNSQRTTVPAAGSFLTAFEGHLRIEYLGAWPPPR